MQRIALRSAVAAGAIVALAAATAACSSSDSSGSGGGGAINIGQVGGYTGQVPGLDGEGYGLQAWVSYTNAHGGIKGHKINLYTGDSKGDPTTEVSQIVQVANQHKVVAFAGMGTFNLTSSMSFIKQNKIPVVGGNISDDVWNKEPYLYPQGSANIPLTALGFGHVPAGAGKVGVVYCKESPGCTQVYNLLVKNRLSSALGGAVAYSAEVSLAAPSFTAQCLAAKAAGVQTLPVAFDPVNMIRLAKNCQQQGFHPVYTMSGTVAADSQASSGLFDKAVAAIPNAPWFLDEGPVKTMRAAMAKYKPGKTIDSTTTEGWASGVVLGKAIENALASNGGKVPTRQDILTGLGKIKNETFGGLTPPLTFTSSGVQPSVFCYFAATVAGRKWTAPNGFTAACPSPAQKQAIAAVQKRILAG
ncbi:branched-chain amino acid transport system substrate-binding protein [Jatrophihabitans endophyticus]|uniref:Branched-chain amino acid transport system substrate-binding protein n=1 Tax=Jatrophihabitans endophyticus TaxID=1206085 RepID=A0A1M5PRA3_9ACTN|nr:ABC transporter substrate-binding protein [Jatrophihabitans endophyticus]SHH04272.1 branched-chain amino acid transport system substrate-binding protein [Jatrophihabitans endophyticus]